MKLSARTHYGTQALLELALNYKDKPLMPLKDIAKRQNIPLRYLEHIVTPLVLAGIVHSSRGLRGGVSLGRPPEKINLKEVVQLLEGPTIILDCLQPSGICSRSGVCATQDLWADITKSFDRILISTTLFDLVEKQKSKTYSKSMYYI